MTLFYKFKKEKLIDNSYAMRPRILVTLSNGDKSLDIPALMDSGSDISVIPFGIAKYLELDLKGEKNELYGYKDVTNVTASMVDITFVGRGTRESVKLSKVPIFIPTEKDNEDNDVVLGINRIFDAFNITFEKSKNKIILRRAQIKGHYI